MNTINKHSASFFLALCLVILCESTLFAQNKPSSDDLFTEARKEAFDAKNYKKVFYYQNFRFVCFHIECILKKVL